MRNTFLHFALPEVDDAELIQIKDAIDSSWITTGPKTKQLEAEFAAYVGAKHAIAVNSGTAAMHLALDAVGLKRGDEVITTTYTFAATAEVVRYFDARPVLVDIRPDDFNIDPELIEKAITERTKAIIPVHIGGLPAELDAVYAIASKYRLAVIEDAAHALPTRYKSQIIGQDLRHHMKSAGSGLRRGPSLEAHSFARLTCFSFYATKPVTTAEGGMICLDRDDLADRCRIMSLHGINKDAWKRYTAEGSWYYEIIAPGYKYNMSDIAAAMGLAQLKKVDRMWGQRREIARRYNEAFKDVRELQIPSDCEDCQHAWHLYMLRLNLHQLQIDRATFIEELKRRNIGASVHFIPLHIHPYYRDTYGFKPEDYPIAYREYMREVSLPIYSRMSDQDTDDVIEAVRDVVVKYGC
jgi:dTDP-4-amino-4,6-dideoxygalactose transaminase